MKIILVGHPGSQCIVKASKYLVEKYLLGFDVIYLNYEGEIIGWSGFVADYMDTIEDEKVIFALDDYLVKGADLDELQRDIQAGPCVKLCETSAQEHREYPVTTQYTIWDRKLLISILRQTTSPWDFEITGSKLITIIPENKPCIFYDVHSALSKRWGGVRINGLEYEDINYLINNKLV